MKGFISCTIRNTNVLIITKQGITIFFFIIIIELTHSKTVLENTVEIEPQRVALYFNNLSQYSSCFK